MAKAKKSVIKKKSGGKKKSSSKTSRSLGANNSINLAGERWPVERDVLFRPDRLKYVRKLIHDEGCVFCKAAQQDPEFETLCVMKTQHSMIVINKFPYNSGHLLVLPLKHLADFHELSAEEYGDLMELIRTAAQGLKEIYQPGGLNLGLNQGAVAGAGIPGHLHYHLVPRWSGDLNFFPLIADTKVVIESLETTYDRLRTYFKKKV